MAPNNRNNANNPEQPTGAVSQDAPNVDEAAQAAAAAQALQHAQAQAEAAEAQQQAQAAAQARAAAQAAAVQAAADTQARADEQIAAVQAQASTEPSPFIWVMSNRVDDRVVLFERDSAHPGGEAFVGGGGAAQVGRSTRVVTLLREGLLIEVPEPVEGRKKPVPVQTYSEPTPATQPGQPIALGRVPDAERFGHGVKIIQASQAGAPTAIPVPLGVTVPPAIDSSRETARR